MMLQQKRRLSSARDSNWGNIVRLKSLIAWGKSDVIDIEQRSQGDAEREYQTMIKEKKTEKCPGIGDEK